MQYVSILIDPVLSHSYIYPKVIESYSLKKGKHGNPWLVQPAIGTKIKVSEMVERCTMMLNEITTHADLNVLPLGSYDVLIDMDWLEEHRAKLDCYNKILECINDEGRPQLVRGMLKKVSIRQISTLQLGSFFKKNC